MLAMQGGALDLSHIPSRSEGSHRCSRHAFGAQLISFDWAG